MINPSGLANRSEDAMLERQNEIPNGEGLAAILSIDPRTASISPGVFIWR